MKKNLILNIEGMHCSMCEKNLTSALKDVYGVKKAKVSLETKTAKITYDDSKTDESKISAAVDEAGYKVVQVD